MEKTPAVLHFARSFYRPRMPYLLNCLESEPQLELNPAWCVPLCSDLAEIRAVDVVIRVIPQHVIKRIDHIQPKFQSSLFCNWEATQQIGIELVFAIAT